MSSASFHCFEMFSWFTIFLNKLNWSRSSNTLSKVCQLTRFLPPYSKTVGGYDDVDDVMRWYVRNALFSEVGYLGLLSIFYFSFRLDLCRLILDLIYLIGQDPIPRSSKCLGIWIATSFYSLPSTCSANGSCSLQTTISLILSTLIFSPEFLPVVLITFVSQ